MDQATVGATPIDAPQDAPKPEEPAPSLAPPSSTSLSDPPTTDSLEAADAPVKPAADVTSAPQPIETSAPAATTGMDPQSHPETTANAPPINPPGWDAAREQAGGSMTASDQIVDTQSPAAGSAPPKRGGRGGKRASPNDGNPTPNKTEGQATPGSSGRGRGGGRPRGRGRGGGRGGKRKRGDGSDGESSDSEVATPAVTMTKSGRNVQKPTSFVPPPQSPTTTTTTKRKRTYRRNPESAVCKMCLRGTSPASNMIVFCDGCNTPYHRYCHQPPIDQAVIDEVDKEWYCKPCENERIVPVPEADVASFVSAPSAPAEQRQKYFASLPPGMLVTLLTRATTLKPDLPLFGPDFEARASASTASGAPPQPTNGQPQQYPQIPQPPPPNFQRQYVQQQQMPSYVEDPRYPVPNEHPAHYVRPGQGLMRNLPPEQDHQHYLVDDDRHQVFSHYHLDPTQGGNGNMGFSGGHGQGIGSSMGMGMGFGQQQAGGGA